MEKKIFSINIDENLKIINSFSLIVNLFSILINT